MGFRIGAMLESFRCGTVEAVRKCVELGVTGVQFYGGSGNLDVDKLSDDDILQFAKLLCDNRLAVSAVCGDLGGFGFERKEENEFKIAKSKRIVDLAVKLNARVVTTHIGVLPQQRNEVYENIYFVCSELGKYAFECGVTFAIETGPEKIADLKVFLDNLPTKGVGVNYDPANIVMVTEDDYVNGVQLLKEYIVHTHAKDGVMRKKTTPEFIYHKFAIVDEEAFDPSPYFLETPLGEGAVDFSVYLHALNDISYCGFLTIEREVGDRPYDDIKKAKDYLTEMMYRLSIPLEI